MEVYKGREMLIPNCLDNSLFDLCAVKSGLVIFFRSPTKDGWMKEKD
jgi:hypothetical protein